MTALLEHLAVDGRDDPASEHEDLHGALPVKVETVSMLTVCGDCLHMSTGGCMGEDKPLRADARRNREAIIAAARAVFEHDEQLRFDDFAARAGVGVGTLYRHFPTREALAAAVYRGEVDALCERGRASSLPPAEALETFLRAFVDYVLEHAPLARTLAGIVDDAARDEGGSELERTLTDLMSRGSPTAPSATT
ncbi:TetR/AcrR family transcriptional regulator [Clavibacter zhangzhiyongii]|uniref:TetR/AcrR family transcriptional regulator n=1 Tax=Clavibacter zhangzhiyongii TaxID=2768071 RepID=UPI0039DF3FC1